MSMQKLCAISIAALVAGCTQAIENPAQSPSYVAATLGYDAYKQGDLQGAETQFETALSVEPDNPYALLGLGAVRENTGDFLAAERLYTAARSVGSDAPANYTYITQQRLEKATNQDVASLAKENLARLDARRLAQQTPVPATDGFASYDGGTASITEDAVVVAKDVVAVDDVDDDVPTLGVALAESADQPASPELLTSSGLPTNPELPATVSYDTQVTEGQEIQPTESYGVVTNGDYEAVGAYEDYVATINGGAATVDAYAIADQSYDAIQPASYGAPVDVMPVAFEPATDGDTPYYAAPLSYGDVLGAEPITVITPAYRPVGQVQTLAVESSAFGGVLAYGQALGNPAPRPATLVDASAAATVSANDTGGLIFLE